MNIRVNKNRRIAYNKSNKIHSGGENDAHQICVTSVPMRINIESGVLYAAGVVTAPPCLPNTRKEACWDNSLQRGGSRSADAENGRGRNKDG